MRIVRGLIVDTYIQVTIGLFSFVFGWTAINLAVGVYPRQRGLVPAWVDLLFLLLSLALVVWGVALSYR